MGGRTQTLLVDAFNVMHADKRLQRLLKRNLDAACQALVEMCRKVHDYDGLAVAVVFDAREDRVRVEHPCGRKTFLVVYAPAALSADGVIERMIGRAADPGSMVVVSRDNMVREAAMVRGATVMDELGLMDWVGRCERGQAGVRRAPSASAGRWNRTMEEALGEKEWTGEDNR